MDEIEKLKDENDNLKQKLYDLKQIKKDEEFHNYFSQRANIYTISRGINYFYFNF